MDRIISQTQYQYIQWAYKSSNNFLYSFLNYNNLLSLLDLI
jgi:hypothetical protein